MQLKASNTAKYFINDEFYHVAIDGEKLIVRSTVAEERIPFAIWDGSIRVRRGILWGELEFFAHIHDGQRYSWLIRGLPWPQCRTFAEKAIAAYRQWHQLQCVKLSTYLPSWQQALIRLQNESAFLPHSEVREWHQQVSRDLTELGMTLDEIEQRVPGVIADTAAWYHQPSLMLSQRNETWITSERERWTTLFNTLESSPLNVSQQSAVLLNDNYNLVLAGAGSGKTSVLSARVAYLIESGLSEAGQILLLSFGKDAALEMEQRLRERVGPAADQVTVSTFHQLGLRIIHEVEGQDVQLSPIVSETKQKEAWMTDWLKKHWMTPTNFKRWQKHLNQWPIAYIKGDEELGSHVENPKLISWLTRQVEQLSLLSLSKKEIQQKIVEREDYPRLNSELALCWPCYQAWNEMLKEQGQLDFNLMISQATTYVRKKKYQSRWAFVMVDEYQDISPPRLALLEALCKQHEPRGNLFAVGDDWQSIYQFAGSDVDLTTGFQQRFPESTVTHLDTTYRFNNRLGEVANTFVQVNPQQIPKSLNSLKVQKSNAVALLPQSRLEKIIEQLNRKNAAKDQVKSLLILGRNHYHKPELLEAWQKQYRQLDIRFMTCHASKGKEADFVIIVHVDEGQFPAKTKTVHLDDVLTLSDETFPHAEERRLFYVAMTRAREKVWVAYNAGGGSSFVKELLEGPYSVSKL
ncbi:DNA helicase IV [Vibrio mangrovi]|uniref:DNA 3'-5' helicase n=1 Tax=Vibrio mangrovi TaxID=474394 RepID=A0A1Y6ITA4_9VIBR|nr:DNA helicase IV [Vibrio mangrovi]MDW6004570.1 DNA helicase IV [Vibrio mangrovi]SMS00858.1 Helicase IV [Vibrio mangrovi]